jgi:pyruvate dehydrogenase E2 component (dihydrolipoamide acetyltransferase)
MAETVTMPKLGFDMAEGTLVRWVKNEGDAVAKGEVLAEIETDKATVEVESGFSGVVRRHLVEQGIVVPVGTPIAVIAAPDETVDMAQGAVPEMTPTQAPKSDAQPEIIPKPVPGPEGGLVETPETASPSLPTDGGHLPDGVQASPLARRIARDRGLDLHLIQGTGPGGRIIRKDLEEIRPLPAAAAPSQPAAPSITPVPAPAQPQAPKQPAVSMPAPVAWTAGAPSLKEETLTLDRLRGAIGRRMAESKQSVPHFYVTHEYDLGAMMDLRKRVNANLAEGEKISVNDFIVKAAAFTLLQYPALNASIDGNQVHRHGHINVGSAVSVPGGLMTIVSKDADQKPIRVISRELREMAVRARSGKVRPDDIEGSTFSISNLGMFDVEEFVAIINPPEAAILAVGSARQVPVVADGEIRIGTRLKLTLSADHRLTDGAEAAQFLQAMAQFLETPLKLLL